MKRVFIKSGLLTLAAFFILSPKGYSIGDLSQVGARDASLGNASVALVSSFSVFNNQAALARIRSISVAIDYYQPFLIEGFASKALAVVVPTAVSNFAICMQQKGIRGYNESRFGLSMARTIGERISAGLQFNYFMVDFPEQARNKGTFVIEFGMLYQSQNGLAIGLHIFNPSQSSVESLYNQTNLPFSATAGIALKPSANLTFVSSVRYTNDAPVNVGMGIEYQLSDSFFLRGGISGKPICHAAGLGYKNLSFGVDFAIVHHQTLGYTPSISLTLNL